MLLLANGCAANINGSGPPVVSDLIVLVICGPGMTLTFLRWRKARQAAAAVTRVPDDHQRAAAAWQQRADAWQRAELSRLDHVDEWGSAEVSAAAPRVDVFGGSLRGWQALLTTHGTSLLASQPVLAVDLTGEVVCQELTDTARAAGVPAAVWLLPAQLGASGVLARAVRGPVRRRPGRGGAHRRHGRRGARRAGRGHPGPGAAARGARR